eukprot:4262270-Ditylum_brightwellii.AAC.1
MPQDIARKHKSPNSRMWLLCTTDRQADQKKDNKTTALSIGAIVKKVSSVNTIKSTQKQVKRTKMTNNQLPGDHRKLTKQQYQASSTAAKDDMA